ncbi:hypothetical protein Pcinc_014236 [Petrolisthes cinctipes]|uniref:Uncharacterized protein n=1 Tax=Petrolisthes cinctipes TaxID=88211 RepID=A0AAE1KRJ9_PETCI|nr:hypothetical protein Pcinc_014236 [Petrolisthes cinctipes]
MDASVSKGKPTFSIQNQTNYFPVCILHIPTGDKHKPVLSVLREKDALKLIEGPYFTMVKREQSEASGVRGAVMECPTGYYHIAFNTPMTKA